jgi:3-oxoacyl-[acyl-carrier-protein] synthase-1
MSVYINAFSCVCAAGLTIEGIFQTLLEGKTAVTFRDGYVLDTPMPLGKIPSNRDFYTLLEENVASLLTKVPFFIPSETIVLVGSSVGGMCRAERKFIDEKDCRNLTVEELSISSIGDEVVQKFGFKKSLSFSSACTSSSIALDFAYDLISNELYKTVVVIGADELSRSAVNGFDRLGIASHAPTTPFDVERVGINVAEGIAVLALSSSKSEHCVELLGCGVTGDAYNITHPHPQGDGSRAAMKMALEKAQLSPADIDYINAHGTGTIANDEIESVGIEALFGSKPYVVSTKAVTGHTLGACGALEVAIGAMSIVHNIIPPCVNLTVPVNPALNHPKVATKATVNYVLSNAFGFGGGNVSVVLGRVL